MSGVVGMLCAKVYYGDGTRIDLLRQAGAAEAELLAFCLDGDAFDAGQVHAIHKAFPEERILMRAYDRAALIKLKGAPTAANGGGVYEWAIGMGRVAPDTGRELLRERVC